MGLGPMELVVILILALIVLGPGKLPEAGRAVGKAIGEFRNAMNPQATNEPAKVETQKAPAKEDGTGGA